MPFPRWLAHVNKRVFNPIEERRGARPVLIHTGRSSGRTYRTPLTPTGSPTVTCSSRCTGRTPTGSRTP